MTGEQIREEIQYFNQCLKESLTPSVFTLNNSIIHYTEEIKRLQTICPHDWGEDNYCIYCNLLKPEGSKI